MKRELLTERETFHLEIPADENNLSRVRDFVSNICISAGFSKRETNNTKLAVDEACTNIIKHAYRDTGGDIKIDVQAEPGKVEVNIFDRGEPFDWSKIEDPDLEQYVEIGKKGGLGIFLMSRLMDDLNYYSSEAGNRLYMVKSASAAAEAGRPFLPAIKPRWTSTLRFKFGMRAGLGLLGLVVFLWALQFTNQTRDVEAQRGQAWVNMSSFARALEAKSENALVIDDLYDPEYRKVTDFILKRFEKLPEVMYVQIVNNDNVIVCSSKVDEFGEEYQVPQGFSEIAKDGDWRVIPDGDEGKIREFHLPVILSTDEGGHVTELGRVVLGVSEAMIERGISDPRPKTALILAGIFLIGVSLIYLLISVLVKPIQALTDGVRAIGDGSLKDDLKIEGPEEIGQIARAFNEITAKFRTAQKNVVEQERLQKEMQVAQEIQHSLLPKNVPQVSGYDIASLYRAAKEVGGDYYDFVNVNDDTLGVVVADVSGKGVPGSLVMTMIRTALRMEARGNLSAAEVMARMNDFVTEDMKKGMFVTIFYVILDSKNRIISYTSAGHNPMILYRAESDETFFLNPRGFPVGISLPDDTLFRRSIDVEKIKLKKNDMLVIYTDGVTEAMNEEREQYGEERLIKLIKEHGRLSPEEFIDQLTDNIKDFTGDYPQNDDITVVAIKEKLMADDVLFGIRKRLLDLVEMEGFSVAEACSKMKVSPSTYYRYRRRMSEMGERGLKNKALRQEHEIKRVNLEQRKEIIEIIKKNPQYGAKRITAVFNRGRDPGNHLSDHLIYDELKRMRLNTYEKRLEYLRRNRIISEDEYELLVKSPSSRIGFEPGIVTGSEQGTETAEVSPGHVEEPAAQADLTELVVEGKEQLKPSLEQQLAQALEFEGEDAGGIRIESKEVGRDIVVLSVEGHLDSSSAGEFEGILESVYAYGYRKIIVDLRSVSYVSSGGWGIFTSRVKTLREGEGDVVLACMSPEVYDIYELLGFRDIIMHFHDIDEATRFLSLTFEERQERLEEMTYARAGVQKLEQRMAESGPVELPEGEEAESVWTPLQIEAGTVGESGEITILYLNGVIDTVSCVELRSIVDDFVDKGNVKLVIDMSRVEYVSSSGWGVFASRINEIRKGGGDIKIFGMDPEVDSIFHLLGFDVIMRSFSILAEAIDDFSESVPLSEDLLGAAEEPREPYDIGISAEEVEGPQSTLKLEVSKAVDNGLVSIVLRVGGAVDAATTGKLERQMDLCIGEGPGCLVVDLSDVVYISSSGWGVIVKCMQRVSELPTKIALAGMSPAVIKIFHDLGLEPLIQQYASAEKALEELAPIRLDDSDEGVVVEEAGSSQVAEVEDEGVFEERRQAASDRGTSEESDFRSAEERAADETTTPKVEKADVPPLKPLTPEKSEDRIVILDFGKNTDLKQDKDKNIRKLGWNEYGKKLFKRGGRSNRGKE